MREPTAETDYDTTTEAVIQRARRRNALPRNPRPRLEMATRWLDLDVAVVLVSGEVDAGNSDEVLGYVLDKALLCHRLILNLTAVGFLGCAGYAMLKTLERRCALAHVDFRIVHGSYTARAIEVCERAADS